LKEPKAMSEQTHVQRRVRERAATPQGHTGAAARTAQHTDLIDVTDELLDKIDADLAETEAAEQEREIDEFKAWLDRLARLRDLVGLPVRHYDVDDIFDWGCGCV
jgi:hypothetical protein